MTLTTVELFLATLVLIFALPYLVWRLGRTDYWAPLVVVQIVTGILLGPGILGAAWPGFHTALFTPAVLQALNGVAWWAVMLFVFLAGVELDLHEAWRSRRDTGVTAWLALAAPMALGAAAAAGLLAFGGGGWVGERATAVQFVTAIGMACAVTALPILILLMEKTGILRDALGQRILRYASLDDLAIWAVLAAVLMDWQRIGRQAVFLAVFAAAAWACRRFVPRLPERDRWYVAMVWLAGVGLAADWAGLHFMVGAFLAGVVFDARWLDEKRLDMLRQAVLLTLMPVFFLSTGLRTQWSVGGLEVFAVAAVLLAAAVAGKLAGVGLAARLLRWPRGEALLIGWFLQTKALIMIVFANVLLDRGVISGDMFTALVLMAVASTMLTVPMVAPRLRATAAPGSGG